MPPTGNEPAPQLGFDLGVEWTPPRSSVRSLGERAAAIAAAIAGPIEAMEVLQTRGASDRVLMRILRRLARAGASGDGWWLGIDRGRPLLTYGDARRVPASKMLVALRSAYAIPAPGEGTASLPDIGSIDDPVQLPRGRWGYREANDWRTTVGGEGPDAPSGYRVVDDPERIRNLDGWAARPARTGEPARAATP